jgi:amino acid transporter
MSRTATQTGFQIYATSQMAAKMSTGMAFWIFAIALPTCLLMALSMAQTSGSFCRSGDPLHAAGQLPI